jgi:hypothetical protein
MVREPLVFDININLRCSLCGILQRCDAWPPSLRQAVVALGARCGGLYGYRLRDGCGKTVLGLQHARQEIQHALGVSLVEGAALVTPPHLANG